MKAPFIWFGGKRKVAPVVWAALGDVDNYVEPFAGSLAVLLARPHRLDVGRRAETVSDADCFLSNFWRALAADPDAVAEHADWPVNECDLFARHLWLVRHGGPALVAGLERDPAFFDAKIAGWWVWGLNAWIGSGWCAGNGPWAQGEDGGVVDLRKRPHLGTAGQGINRKRPHLGTAGQGINRQLPHLGTAGRGINRQLPHLGTAGRGICDYFTALAERLRTVRVCCGDWSRVVTDGALAYGATVGVFLDPPYGDPERDAVYTRTDDFTVAADVRAWALAHGDNPRFRIVLAGYVEEHGAEMPAGWRRHRWRANRAYGSANGGGANDANRRRECLWFSPHCLAPAQRGLFDAVPPRGAAHV